MKHLPVPDPGDPDTRSAGHYLVWLARRQAATMLGGMAYGVLWMAMPALMPAVLGRGVDAVSARDQPGLLRWSLVFLALGAVGAAAGIMRHRFAVTNWLTAAYRTMQLTARQAARLGATLPRRVSAGEVVSIGTSDLSHVGHALDILARGSGAVVSIVVVGAVLLAASVPLGLLVLLGVPAMLGAVSLLLRPLHRRQQHYRDLTANLATRSNDIVAGLRVLRGVGGEAAFADRFRADSQRLRTAGVRVVRVESLLNAAEVLVPGIFVTLVTWLGARFALAGRISPGELVAFYGYAAFLLLPLRTLTETADKITRGLVAAHRVVTLLTIEPEVADRVEPGTGRLVDGDLADPPSGLLVPAGRLTAVVAADPRDAAALADRLGRYDPAAEATLAGVPLRDLPLDGVRRHILVADNDAVLFTGDLRGGLDPTGAAGDERIAAALHAASADDVLTGLPGGLDTPVAERGREFSGGQRQRLRLARALVVDPPVLILVEPTSAVDAHTEAWIAARLRRARAGRTTVLTTTSPLLLDRADLVAYLEEGKVVVEGTHRELLRTEPRYRAVVDRAEDAR